MFLPNIQRCSSEHCVEIQLNFSLRYFLHFLSKIILRVIFLLIYAKNRANYYYQDKYMLDTRIRKLRKCSFYHTSINFTQITNHK